LNENQEIIAAYQVAVQLWAHCGDEVWQRFNVMIVVNSLIISFIGFIISSANSLKYIMIFVSFVGIILCILWYLLLNRGLQYQKYYLKSAREIESTLHNNKIVILSKGASFGFGQEIKLKLESSIDEIKMGKLACLLTAEDCSYIIVFIFIHLYIGIGLLYFFH
jgi:hypothetical protein